MEDFLQLIRVVEKMRYFQREYIANHDRFDLMDAKRMERECDALIVKLRQKYQ